MKLGDEIACSGCGVVFVRGKKSIKYCSDHCKKEGRRRAIYKYNNSKKGKINSAIWVEQNADRNRANKQRYAATEKGIATAKRKIDVVRQRLLSDLEYRKHHNKTCLAWQTKKYRENEAFRNKSKEASAMRWSKVNYGDYAEAHRALCQTKTIIKEIKDGT